MASDEPRASCQPTRKTRRTTTSAMPSARISNALSPNRDGGFILAATDSGAAGIRTGSIASAIGMPGLLHLDFVDSFQRSIAKRIRKRRILQLLSDRFAFGQRPFQEIHHFLAFGGVLLLLVDEKPGRSTNWISLFAR